MKGQAYRMEYEFEKECINQMARSTQRKYGNRFDGKQDMRQTYQVSIKIGHGHTYSKYNTLMHFLNVMECYWQNPDLNNIQVRRVGRARRPSARLKRCMRVHQFVWMCAV